VKIVFLSTSSNETRKYADSFAALGHRYDWIVYDVPEYNEAALARNIAAREPAMIVYIGSRWGPQVSTAALAHLNGNVAPTVHFCSDAADPPWHDKLSEYHYAGSFRLQVAIDGNPKWPNSTVGMTALTPIDPANFSGGLPHLERPIMCGFAGNAGSNGSARRFIISEMMLHKTLDVRLRIDRPDSYAEMCKYIESCRMTLNMPWTGSGQTMHVKGRVVETGLAGGCLIEFWNSPANLWFTPGEDYLEFSSPEEAIQIVQLMRERPDLTEAMGKRLREKVLAEHTPLKFWTKICERIGVKG